MATTAFEDKNTSYAYNCIHEFFDNYGLCGAVQDIDRILKAAISQKQWKRADPYTVLYYMEKLEELCGAAFVIHTNYAKRDAAIIEATENDEPDMSIQQHFVGRHLFRTVWSYFPRNLTAGQYYNPYKAIKKFAGYMPEPGWKKIFKEITEYALSNRSINDEYYPYNMLTIRLRLLQLIEACHLLEVRTNINTAPKAKQKKKKIKH